MFTKIFDYFDNQERYAHVDLSYMHDLAYECETAKKAFRCENICRLRTEVIHNSMAVAKFWRRTEVKVFCDSY